jgi:hypothetical protein
MDGWIEPRLAKRICFIDSQLALAASEHAIDSGIGLSETIDKLRIFINKTLSILSAYQ